MDLHPGQRWIDYSRHSLARESLSDLSKLSIAGLVVCLLVALVVAVEMAGAPSQQFEGTVVGRKTTLVGRVPVPAAAVQSQEGPYRWQVVKVSDDNQFKPGDTVVVSVYQGKLTGGLHGTDIAGQVSP